MDLHSQCVDKDQQNPPVQFEFISEATNSPREWSRPLISYIDIRRTLTGTLSAHYDITSHP